MNLESAWGELRDTVGKRRSSESGTGGVAKEVYSTPLFRMDCAYLESELRGIVFRFTETVNESGIGNHVYGGFYTQEIPEGVGGFELYIYSAKQEYNEVFRLFCENLIPKIITKKTTVQVLQTIRSHIRLWQKFMHEVSEKKLTEEEVKGLFGELYFLNTTLIPLLGPKKAVLSWRGPGKKAQDFVFDKIAVEVKTSSGKGMNTVRISNEEQLNNSAFDYLFLYYIRVVETGSCSENLNNMVDTILKQLEEFPETREIFERELMRCHYIPGSKINEEYEPYGFLVQRTCPFEVRDDFPCLTRVKYLEDWVYDVSYSIKISYMKPFLISEEEFRERIGGI